MTRIKKHQRQTLQVVDSPAGIHIRLFGRDIVLSSELLAGICE